MPPIPTVRTNGSAITTFRERLTGLNLTQLAEKAGVAVSALHYYETEQKNPSLGILVKVAIALDVPVQSICRDKLTDAQLTEADEILEIARRRQAS